MDAHCVCPVGPTEVVDYVAQARLAAFHRTCAHNEPRSKQRAKTTLAHPSAEDSELFLAEHLHVCDARDGRKARHHFRAEALQNAGGALGADDGF
jgi:hypothetical protein